MRVPHFVRRATLRLLAGGLTCAVAVALIGLIGERVRFGADLPAARGRIERDVRQQFATLGARLETAVDRLRRDPAVTAGAANGRDAGTSELFDRLAEVQTVLNLPGAAITVYGSEAR